MKIKMKWCENWHSVKAFHLQYFHIFQFWSNNFGSSILNNLLIVICLQWHNGNIGLQKISSGCLLLLLFWLLSILILADRQPLKDHGFQKFNSFHSVTETAYFCYPHCRYHTIWPHILSGPNLSFPLEDCPQFFSSKPCNEFHYQDACCFHAYKSCFLNWLFPGWQEWTDLTPETF